MEAAIRVGLLMGIVMISTTIYTAPMMEVIAVDLMSIQHTAQIANALMSRGIPGYKNIIWKKNKASLNVGCNTNQPKIMYMPKC